MYSSQARIISLLLLFTCLSGGNLCFARKESLLSPPPIIHNVNISQDDSALDAFLLAMLGEHPNWLKENNLDPSIPFSQPANLSFNYDEMPVELDCQISNYYVGGWSQGMDIHVVSSSLVNRYISLGFLNSGNITFGGDYSATGSVLNSSLSGSGDWRIVSQSVTQNIHFNFEITEDGHLSITQIDPKRTLTWIREHLEIEFEGLLDGGAHGHEDKIKFFILAEFNEFLSNNELKSGLYPGRGEMYEYFQKLFSDTPLSEIIGTTFPSTQSSTPAADTTTGFGSSVRTSVPPSFIAGVCVAFVILLN